LAEGNMTEKRLEVIATGVMTIIGYSIALYFTLYLMAPTFPSLRWLPGYDPDIYGVYFLLVFFAWPLLALIGISALILGGSKQLPLFMRILPLAYVLPLALIAWLADQGWYTNLVSQDFCRYLNSIQIPLNSFLCIATFSAYFIMFLVHVLRLRDE
jgi:hypothetical protein